MIDVIKQLQTLNDENNMLRRLTIENDEVKARVKEWDRLQGEFLTVLENSTEASFRYYASGLRKVNASYEALQASSDADFAKSHTPGKVLDPDTQELVDKFYHKNTVVTAGQILPECPVRKVAQ